jgi:hypothetical protein
MWYNLAHGQNDSHQILLSTPVAGFTQSSIAKARPACEQDHSPGHCGEAQMQLTYKFRLRDTAVSEMHRQACAGIRSITEGD